MSINVVQINNSYSKYSITNARDSNPQEPHNYTTQNIHAIII